MRLSVAYLFLSMFGVWRTASAIRRPDPSKPPYRRPMWLAATLTSELIPLRILVHLSVTALFVYAGAAEHAPGRVGLALTAGSLVAMVYLQLRNRRTADAVAETLGPLPSVVHAPAPSALRASIGYPYRTPADVERIDDVTYDGQCSLDLYRSGDGRPKPILLQIHGGGWGGGNRRQQARPLLHAMAQTGWLSVSASYPLTPEATFPEQLIALKRAVVWLRSEASRYGGDPTFIAATGGSAGAHLAALLALTSHDASLQPGFEDEDTSVNACVPLYGVYDFLNRNRTRDDWPIIPHRVMKATPEEDPAAYRLASPFDQIHASAPPFLVVHGSHDSLVPIGEGRQFYDALARISRSPAYFLEVPGANHAFDILPSLRTQHVVAGVHRFLEAARSNTLPCVHPQAPRPASD